MATSTVTVTTTKTGMLTGGQEGPNTTTYTNTGAPDNITSQAFSANTFAAVTVPTGSLGVRIIPPTANTGAITLKGITGDTGIPLNKTMPNTVLTDGLPAFGLLCVSAITVVFEWL